MSLAKTIIRLFLRGLIKQTWCFRHGAFVVSDSNSILFNILKRDDKTYKRISSHQKHFSLNNVNKIQYGLDFPKFEFSCQNSKNRNISYRTLLFFQLPKERLYMKFEKFGTKKKDHLFWHGIDYIRTRHEVPRASFRKEKLSPFTNIFPSNWNADQNAINYHQDRVGREVFLSRNSLLRLLHNGLAL